MNERLLKEIHEARKHVAIGWDDARARTVERELLERAGKIRSPRQSSTWMRVGYAFAALVMVAAVSALAIRSFRRDGVARGVPHEASLASTARSIRLDDGTTIVLGTDESSIRTLESAPGTVGIELVRGTAHFDVSHNPGRIFRVIASDVTIEVVGTTFVVERYASSARVTVEEGRVKVRWGDDVRILSAGEAGTFGPQLGGAVGPNDDPAERESHDGGAPSLSGKGQKASPGEWRSLAREGDFGRAYEALRIEGPSAVRDEPNELLLQADVARLSGHPEQAIAPLKRVLSSHAADAHAPLAAFTLGRVLLDELKRPRDAAQAFARVYRLEPSGPLAQDALAREVEAWSRAGETALAHDRGLRYVESYPQGRKLNAVRRNAGLE